jgi:RNA polymerase sigma-70 factor, ECF subfamily
VTVTRLALVPTNPDRVTEPDLVARVVAGDRLAARALYDAHVGRVHRLACRLTGDPQLAEEVTQDTFVRAIAHLGRFRGDCALTTWLHRITVTVALNATRGTRRRQERETSIDDADGDALGAFGDDGERIDPILRDRLHRAVDALPEIYRTVVVMHDFEGYSHVEIAEVLDIPVGTCRSRLFLARAQLRVALGDLKGEIHG